MTSLLINQRSHHIGIMAKGIQANTGIKKTEDEKGIFKQSYYLTLNFDF